MTIFIFTDYVTHSWNWRSNLTGLYFISSRYSRIPYVKVYLFNILTIFQLTPEHFTVKYIRVCMRGKICFGFCKYAYILFDLYKVVVPCMSFLVNSCILRPISLVLSPVILRLYYTCIYINIYIYAWSFLYVPSLACCYAKSTIINHQSLRVCYLYVTVCLVHQVQCICCRMSNFHLSMWPAYFIFMYEYSLPVINPTLKKTMLNFDLDKWCRNERFSTPTKFGYTQRSPHRNCWGFFIS
jgi:hypothetical protein